MAEVRCLAHGFPLPTFGHRQRFGNAPVKYVDFLADTLIAPWIPPFLGLFFCNHSSYSAPAQRRNNLGKPDNPPTGELFKFVESVLER